MVIVLKESGLSVENRAKNVRVCKFVKLKDIVRNISTQSYARIVSLNVTLFIHFVDSGSLKNHII